VDIEDRLKVAGKRLAKANAEAEKARRELAPLVRQAHVRGLSYRRIADLCGLSFPRVQQIVQQRR
jgi:DNA-directed RNA polymerase specialized sigma24 family protein